jgi:hypothetical protein
LNQPRLEHHLQNYAGTSVAVPRSIFFDNGGLILELDRGEGFPERKLFDFLIRNKNVCGEENSERAAEDAAAS